MNRKSHNRRRGHPSKPKPMAMVGAGPLTSAIWKSGDEQGGWRYRFNLFRQLAGNGHVSQLFRPSDLRHVVKLTQVLAAVLADDGCLSAAERRLLRQLATTLDEVTRRLDLCDQSTDSHAPHRPSRTPWKGKYGDSANS